MTALLAGVDLGGTAIKVALADFDGNVIIQDSIETRSHEGPEAVIDRIADFVRVLAERSQTAAITHVGMGVPGLVELSSGTTKFLPNLPTQWRDVPVARLLGNRLNCSVSLLNDVRTAALGELQFGHGQGNPALTLAFFSLGTGVGGAVAIDGDVRLGPLGAAGELGHQTILPEGPRCGCGNRGCLETLASGPAIAAEGARLMRMGLAPKLHELVSGDADRVTTREMSVAAEQDESIREAIERAATYVGIAAANVAVILHPDMIVLGGGVAELGPILLHAVRNVITERVGMFPTDTIQVLKSGLGEHAGVIGGIALARNNAMGM